MRQNNGMPAGVPRTGESTEGPDFLQCLDPAAGGAPTLYTSESVVQLKVNVKGPFSDLLFIFLFFFNFI